MFRAIWKKCDHLGYIHLYAESFANFIQKEAADLGIMDIASLPKSTLKKRVKESVKTKMEEEIAAKAKQSSKLRFITTPVVFEKAEYINELSGDEAIEVMKIRLNMVNIHGNYKSDLTKCRRCPHCEKELDTTEHLLQCRIGNGDKEGGKETLYKTDVEGWKDILNIVDMNLSARSWGEQ